MEHNISLLSAQVQFLDTRLVLIHIPLSLYNYFTQPILQLILPSREHVVSTPGFETPANSATLRPRRQWAYEYPFVNVSVTPVECSIVCSTRLAEHLFRPLRDSLGADLKKQVSISDEEYLVIQVEGEGLDAGQRVLELTSPLAMNGVSLFFISTYFSDYVIVPCKFQATVISALEERGFEFSSHTETFVNVSSPLIRPRSSSLTSSVGHNSYVSSIDLQTEQRPPPTPPPSSIAEMEARTFNMLARVAVYPVVDPTIQLVQCAGRKDSTRRDTGGVDAATALASHRLQLGIIKCLISTPRPTFVSVTLTDTEPVSLLLEKRLLANFGDLDRSVANTLTSVDNVLLLSQEEVLVPIILDLHELPMESTGIVCGIAGRLVGASSNSANNGHPEEDLELSVEMADFAEPASSIEMSYLSTTLAGAVMVNENDLDRALVALKQFQAPAPEEREMESRPIVIGGGSVQD